MSDETPTTYRRRSTSGRQSTTHRADRRVRLAAIIAAVVVALVMLLALVDGASSFGRVHPGVSVGGVKVGGMVPARARLTLESELPGKSKAPVVVVYQDKKWTVSPDDLELTFDYDSLVSQAMAVGRANGFFANVGERFHAWFGGAALPVAATADPAKMAAVLDEVAATSDIKPRDAGVKFKGTEATVTVAKSGMALDRSALTTEVLAAFTSEDRRVAAPVHVAQADVGDAAAQAAKTAALAMIAEPATITWGTEKWKLSSAELADMLAFRKIAPSAGASWTLEPYVSAAETSKTVAPKLGSKIGHPAVNARFKTRNGSVTIIPAKTGIGPDIESLAVALTTALKSAPGQPRVVELHTRKTVPKITTAMARDMHIKERISTFTTLYVASNKPRVNNIHLLGDSLDGQLIAPGDTFSFNGAIGERTAAKGYQEANAIVDGKLVPQLGGGICQVGTTLFNTVFKSGLPVIERHNHSFYISHYPTGRDATVSWGGPDLKFKNSTDDWLLISVSYSAGSITISLYGTDPGYTVKSKTSDWSNEKPFPTEEIKDPKLSQGVKIIEDPGVTGRTCTVTRTVLKDGEVVRVDTFKSVYRPKVEIVRVGTKTKPSKNSTDKAGTSN